MSHRWSAVYVYDAANVSSKGLVLCSSKLDLSRDGYICETTARFLWYGNWTSLTIELSQVAFLRKVISEHLAFMGR